VKRRAENEAGHGLNALVRRARDGDRDAFGELFLLYAPDVRRLLWSVIGPSDEIDDLVQEVFLQAFRALSGFRGESRFATWLHQIAVYVSYGHLRRLRRRALPVAQERLADLDAPEREGPHARFLGGETLVRLQAVLDSIKPKKRVAFVLFAVKGFTAAEIAELVGAPVTTVKSRIWFARRELRKKARRDPCLGPLLEESEERERR